MHAAINAMERHHLTVRLQYAYVEYVEQRADERDQTVTGESRQAPGVDLGIDPRPVARGDHSGNSEDIRLVPLGVDLDEADG